MTQSPGAMDLLRSGKYHPRQQLRPFAVYGWIYGSEFGVTQHFPFPSSFWAVFIG